MMLCTRISRAVRRETFGASIRITALLPESVLIFWKECRASSYAAVEVTRIVRVLPCVVVLVTWYVRSDIVALLAVENLRERVICPLGVLRGLFLTGTPIDACEPRYAPAVILMRAKEAVSAR